MTTVDPEASEGDDIVTARADMNARVTRLVADMHAVYRMFDAQGRLLYIGRTKDPGQRFADHSMKRWFPLVATITLEWFPSLTAADLAERQAIQEENPWYNIAETARTRWPPTSLDRARPAIRRVRRPRRPVPAAAGNPEALAAVRSRLLGLLAAENGTTTTGAAIEFGVSNWTARVWLERLRAEGFAKVHGSGRGARWRPADGDGS